MSTQVKLRRGTSLEHETFTGASAELTVDTTEQELVLHDGVTPGGKRIGQRKNELVTPVNSVADLAGFAGTKDDQQISLKGWHPDSDVGGGILYWDAAKPKSEHNGGTVFSPTVPFSATTGDYLDGVGETDSGGSGCWVRSRKSDTATQTMFGIRSGDTCVSSFFRSVLGEFSKIELTEGVYEPQEPIVVKHQNTSIVLGDGVRLIQADSNFTTPIISFEGEKGVEVSLAADALKDSISVEVVGASTMYSVGDIVTLRSDAKAYPTGRYYDTASQSVKIKSISGNTIYLEEGLVSDFLKSSSSTISRDSLLVGASFFGGLIETESTSLINGVSFTYCESPCISNTKVVGFRGICIVFTECYAGIITKCGSELRYRDALQYGCVLYRCTGVRVTGNYFETYRTAIDISRLSRNCIVQGNVTLGNINTHTAHHNKIADNIVSEGTILIRGPYNTVTGNQLSSYTVSTGIYILEAGRDGESWITGNTVVGKITALHRIPTSGVVYKDNNFYITELPVSNNLIELEGLDSQHGGVVISGNRFELLNEVANSTCIYSKTTLNIVEDLYFENNTIVGFDTGINSEPFTDNTISKNLKIAGNVIKGVKSVGINFRLTDNVHIIDNIIEGHPSGGLYGIFKAGGGSSVREVVRIANNVVTNFGTGLKVIPPNYNDAFLSDNMYISCTTKEDVGGALTLYTP